jgi:hypothetical protein
MILAIFAVEIVGAHTSMILVVIFGGISMDFFGLRTRPL